MDTSPALQALDARRSVPSMELRAPGPDEATLLRMLQSAVRVPDHGKLVPFRFVRIAGDARHALGRFLAARALQRDPAAPPQQVEKDRQRFSHAPVIVAVVARLQAGHKVPEQEQLLSAGCVAYNLLLGAQAQGYGAQWLTGWAAYDREAASLLGLGDNERIVAFVHVGTAREPAPERMRPALDSVVSEWR